MGPFFFFSTSTTEPLSSVISLRCIHLKTHTLVLLMARETAFDSVHHAGNVIFFLVGECRFGLVWPGASPSGSIVAVPRLKTDCACREDGQKYICDEHTLAVKFFEANTTVSFVLRVLFPRNFHLVVLTYSSFELDRIN